MGRWRGAAEEYERKAASDTAKEWRLYGMEAAESERLVLYEYERRPREPRLQNDNPVCGLRRHC